MEYAMLALRIIGIWFGVSFALLLLWIAWCELGMFVSSRTDRVPSSADTCD